MKNILDLKIYKIYDVNKECFIATFDTLEEMLVRIANKQTVDSWCGTYRKGLEKEWGYSNHYLDNVNMTFNDIKVWHKYDGVEEVYLRDYVFLDPDNRIIDPREYIDRILEIVEDLSYYNKKYRKPSKYSLYYRCYEKSSVPYFREGPVPGTGKARWHRGSYYRHPKTTNEKRKAAIVEDKEFIKPSRRIHHLADVYDEIPRHFEKSWKSQSKKRKQWM